MSLVNETLNLPADKQMTFTHVHNGFLNAAVDGGISRHRWRALALLAAPVNRRSQQGSQVRDAIWQLPFHFCLSRSYVITGHVRDHVRPRCDRRCFHLPDDHDLLDCRNLAVSVGTGSGRSTLEDRRDCLEELEKRTLRPGRPQSDEIRYFMKAIVTGAAGFIGFHVARTACRAKALTLSQSIISTTIIP